MPAKPSITDEHYKRYNDILATPVKSAAPVPPSIIGTPAKLAPPAATSDVPAAPGGSTPQKASLVSSLISSIPPKAKGISNKVFIFTGKKKIVLDGEEQEVEKIKTVSPEKQIVPETPPPPEKKITVNIAPPVPTAPPVSAPPPIPSEIPSINKAPIEELKPNPTDKKAEPVKIIPIKPFDKKSEKSKTVKSGKGTSPFINILLSFAVVFLLGAWTVFWAVFFGILKL